MGKRDQGANFTRLNLLAGVSAAAMLVATPALAQEAPAQASDQPPPTDQPAPLPQVAQSTRPTSSDNQIVVTGSRIRQPEFTSPDPVALIDPSLARREGKQDLAQTLQQSPIAAGSTQVTSAISSNFVTNGGPGSQTIDLRGLGANRTLVLLNGRRAGPAGTRGGVSSFDLNVLPQSIVSRVDVLKTGASSIYGSDAIAGVVNLITKTDVDGFELDINSSVPTDSGGESYRIAGMWGKKLGERGHVMVALDYFKQQELARGDRNWLGCPEARVYTDETNRTRADLIDPRTGKPHCEDFPVGQVWTYDLGYQASGDFADGNLFTTNGVYAGGVALMQYQYPGEVLGIPGIDPAFGFSAPPGFFPTGHDGPSLAVQNDFHPFVLQQSIIPETTRYTIYGDAAYEINDNVEAYAEFLGNRRKTYQNGWSQIWAFGYTGDLYGDGSYGTYWADGWTGYNWLSPTPIANHADQSQKVDYWRGVGGLRGDFGNFLNGWSYDAYVQYSHNKGTYKTEQFLQEIYDISYFQTSSCVGTTLPFSGKQCMDLPWVDPQFLIGNFTPEQADYMFDWETGKTIYKQLSGEASVTGNLFELPAGAVGVALGATIRRDEIEDTPGEITYAPNPYYDPSIPLDDDQCTTVAGRRASNYACQQFHNNAWGGSAAGITAGHSITKEIFGEIQIPILKDKPFARDLSFSGAARLTSVKSVQRDPKITDKDSGNWTYKLGGNWAVNDWLRFRSTYGTSFRAPALFEQFKANETSFISARNIDPCVRVDQNLAQGNISSQVAERCIAELEAINVANPGTVPNPGNYAGGSIFASVFSQGGIGVLDPETSKAKTFSVILTPTFGALPDTRFSLAVDYYDIEVNDQISQLGAANIVLQCYESATYPTDPLCGLFTRGQAVDAAAIATINDKYVNIASQRNKGVDFTGLIQQRLGSWGSINILASVTRTLKQTFQIFDTQEPDDLLGVIDLNNGISSGTRKWVGDFNVTWRAPDDWTIFWGVDWFGGADNEDEFRAAHGGDLCEEDSFNIADPTIPIRGFYCVDVKVPSTMYHNASITKEIGKKFEFTVGMSNIFDKRPPLVSTIGGTGIPALIGPVVGTSQYDFLGRRMFINVTRKF